MRVVLLTCALAACQYEAPQGTIGPDAEPDAAPPGDAPCVSFSTMIDSCALPPGQPLSLSGNLTFDTNTGDLFAGATPVAVSTMTLVTASGEIEAILASTVVLAADTKLRAEGARGFAIIASESIELSSNALIDVSINGAGARSTCPDAPGVGTNRNGGAGGGGGGGFGGAGGTGAAGDSDGSSTAPGGLGALAVAMPAGILGGCPGAAGGDDDNDDGGRGGFGGGAVYLAAGERIELAAGSGIDASGEGGRGGDQHGLFNGDAGGGGGGSGGMIVLEAPMVTSAGTLAANGGGGGEGSGNGSDGDDGDRGVFGTTRANGGSGSSPTGSDGGSGGAKGDHAGSPANNPQAGGGGGGGGGAGFIRILAPTRDLNAAISPDPI